MASVSKEGGKYVPVLGLLAYW